MKIYRNKNKSIIAAIKNGDDYIIEEFYKVHLPQVANYVLKNSGNLDDAKDIFQDALVIVYERIKEDALTINCALGTYVYSICKYIWFNKLRKAGRINENNANLKNLQEPIDDIVDKIDRSEQVTLIQKYLLQLGSGCKDILLMFFGGYSLREIAKHKKFTEGYTRKRKFLCQKKLIELAEKDPIFRELQNAMQ